MFCNVIDPDEDNIITEDDVYVLSFNTWLSNLHEASELSMSNDEVLGHCNIAQ